MILSVRWSGGILRSFFFSFLIGVALNYSQDQDEIVLGVYSHVIIIRCSEAL